MQAIGRRVQISISPSAHLDDFFDQLLVALFAAGVAAGAYEHFRTVEISVVKGDLDHDEAGALFQTELAIAANADRGEAVDAFSLVWLEGARYTL